MNWLPSKKIISLIILMMAFVSSMILAFGKDKGTAIVSSVRNLTPGDKIDLPENNNWQGDLSGITKNLSLTNKYNSSTTDQTLMDKVSVSLLANYLSLKQSDSLNGESAQNLIDQTISFTSIDQNQTKKYSESDLIIIPDNGKLTISRYGDDLGGIIKNNAPQNPINEVEIIKEIASTKDKDKIKDLEKVIDVYKNVLGESSTMQVPKTFVKAHLDILNSLNGIVSGLETTKNVLTDPIQSLVGLKIYQENIILYANVMEATILFIKQNNIVYKQGSGGFYLLQGI